MRAAVRPIFLISAALASVLALPGFTAAAAPEGVEFFEQHVRPVLVERCTECHGMEKQESGLRLDSLSTLLEGGASGPAVVPGHPEDSLLMSAVRHESFEMPPGERLSDEQIAALEQWIRIGAPWPEESREPQAHALGDQEHIGRVAKTHWSLQPLSRPQPPALSDAAWVQTPIDAFILARLEAAGLKPSPPADRRTLLRRLSLDLIGLPPTPEEVDAFVKDSSPDAIERAVDRLLASPHYGERWGRHWLDVARYADTRDWQAQTDPRYPFAWTYRDWVIGALNDDMPYDEFVRLQLAADFYVDDPHSPNLAALGLLTVGPRYRNNANEQIDDRIDVVTRGLMSLTVSCARCHDHKYDPIPTADYYSLYGVFASVEEPAEYPIIGGTQPPAELLSDYERVKAEKQNDLLVYKQDLQREAMTDLHQRLGEYLLAYYELNIAKKASVRALITSRKLKETAITPLAENLDAVRTNAAWKTHPVLVPWATAMALQDTRTARELEKLLAAGEPPINAAVRAALEEHRPKNRRELIELYVALLTEAASAAAAAKDQPLDDPAQEEIRQLLAADDGPFYLDMDEVTSAARLLGGARNKQGNLLSAIKEVDITHPGAPARAMVVVDKERPITAQIFIRGESRRRGDRVPRRFLSILSGGNAPEFTDGSGRRELAEAITDPANPLTARSIVNRVWMHHFGQGLVSSPGDFGLRSDPPTHPELLDWLASNFIEQGWSLKSLHRTIVLSSTYQQASQASEQGAAVDPDNMLLWRANRRRLDFEAMRDSMLVVAERLDTTVGGRSVPLTTEPFTTRRTVYGYVDRVNLDPIFATFDFASPDATTPERSETLVPQQALFVLNHPFVVEQARAIIAQPEFSQLADDEQRVKYLFRQMFARRARPFEVSATVAYVQKAAQQKPVAHGPWQYGYGPADAVVDADSRFTPLEFWSGTQYQIGPKLPDPKLGHLRLSANGGHPGRNLDHAVIRRWTSPVEAIIEIRGELAHLRDNGDGVRAQIVAEHGGVLGAWTVLNSTQRTNVERYLVKAGERIDFIVDSNQNQSSDAHNWAPQIRVIERVEGAPPPTQTEWDARKDFAAPPPPPLEPWAQVAQALLVTNEFMFID